MLFQELVLQKWQTFINDFFSFSGCILAELYTGYPLFPGENEVEQLACIMEVINLPPDDLINSATRRRLFFGVYHFVINTDVSFLFIFFSEDDKV